MSDQLIVSAIADNLDTMIYFIRKEAENSGFHSQSINRIHLACEEALMNVINYAYGENQEDQEGKIEVVCDKLHDPAGLFIKIIDQGISYNPLEKEDPDIDAPLEERQIGGLGIYMIKQIMDEVNYSVLMTAMN